MTAVAARFKDHELMGGLTLALTATMHVDIRSTWRFRFGWWLIRTGMTVGGRIAGIGHVSCDMQLPTPVYDPNTDPPTRPDSR